jgi:hypothetical protein
MSCCGRGKALQRPLPLQNIARPPARAPHQQVAPVMFEYAGPGAIAVTGPFTGTIYRFGAAGQRVPVRGADAASLLGVPGLKPVR